MRIDSHQHFWKYNPVKDSWIDESMEVIKRDFLPEDLMPVLNDNKIDGTVAVQADQSEDETVFLLNLADEYDFIKGVVGWLDLKSNDLDTKLKYYSKHDKFCGLRHIVQSEPQGFLENLDFLRGIALLEKYNLTYDILVYHYQLPEVIPFVENFPNQKFVLDHIGKPAISLGTKSKEFENWKKNIYKLANNNNIYCKISGMVTETTFNQWRYDDFVPYLDVVTKAFGIDRIMFGSDWPVCLLSGGYANVLKIIENYYKSFSKAEIDKLMGNNAIVFYKL